MCLASYICCTDDKMFKSYYMRIQCKEWLFNSLKQTLLLLSMLSVSALQGQNYEPIELAKEIFSPKKFSDLKRYCTGEYKGNPNGQDLQKGTRTSFRLLRQTNSHAVVKLTLLDPAGKGFDAYLHFEKDSIWKLEAFRALAMTGMIEMGLSELEKMTLKEVDEIVVKSKDKNDDNALFRSREDYYYELGNARLTLALDDTIKQHFLDNYMAFEQLRDLVIKDQDTIKSTSRKGQEKLLGQKTACHKLFIKAVYSKNYNTTVLIDFFIGGMIDNTVGYFYTNDKNSLPEMSSRNYIMIREIREGWYIYKTT